MPARSDISGPDFDNRLSGNSIWAALTDDSKVQIVNSVTQWVCNLYNQAGKQNYRSDNLVGSTGGVVVGAFQSSYLTSVPLAGSPVTFDIPFSENLATGDYHLSINAYASSAPDAQTMGFTLSARDGSGFTVLPDFDAAFVTWSAVPFTT